jgi:hypothetical protein
VDPAKLVSTTLYLQQYMMEAVGFTEFIYEEATQQGIRVLRQMKKKKAYKDLPYMAKKFEDNIFNPAWAFHKNFGPLNPWTYPGFEAFYNDAWATYRSIYSSD